MLGLHCFFASSDRRPTADSFNSTVPINGKNVTACLSGAQETGCPRAPLSSDFARPRCVDIGEPFFLSGLASGNNSRKVVVLRNRKHSRATSSQECRAEILCRWDGDRGASRIQCPTSRREEGLIPRYLPTATLEVPLQLGIVWRSMEDGKYLVGWWEATGGSHPCPRDLDRFHPGRFQRAWACATGFLHT